MLMNNPNVDQVVIKYMPGASDLTQNEQLWFELGESWVGTGQFFPPGYPPK
jgi:hypothetical protein